MQDRNPIQISTEGIDLDKETVFCIAIAQPYYSCNLISNPKSKAIESAFVNALFNTGSRNESHVSISTGGL